MSDSASHQHLTIDYIEIAAVDLDAAKAFYGAAFEWTFTDYGPDYAGFRERGGTREAGGFTKQDQVRSGGPLVILYSSDLEATRDAVRAAGGGIVKDIFAFPGGRRFQFTDPSGNELGVWSDR
jgi:uncharacterized protein